MSETSREKRPVSFEIDASAEIVHGVAVLRVVNTETGAEEVKMVTLRNPINADQIGLLRTALLKVEAKVSGVLFG